MVSGWYALVLQSILMTQVREQPLGLTDQAEIPDARSMDRSQDSHPSPTLEQGEWGDWAKG